MKVCKYSMTHSRQTSKIVLTSTVRQQNNLATLNFFIIKKQNLPGIQPVFPIPPLSTELQVFSILDKLLECYQHPVQGR